MVTRLSMMKWRLNAESHSELHSANVTCLHTTGSAMVLLLKVNMDQKEIKNAFSTSSKAGSCELIFTLLPIIKFLKYGNVFSVFLRNALYVEKFLQGLIFLFVCCYICNSAPRPPHTHSIVSE